MSPIAVRTADTTNLKTWWHPTGEINTSSSVADGNVRQSRLYSVQVSLVSNADHHDSFVYETIPRSGKGQICYPGDYNNISSEPDGITIENDIALNMAWTQFLYNSDVVVKVTCKDGVPVSARDVIIRPTTLRFKVATSNGSALITVPYNSDTHGVRFSVELAQNIWTFRNAGPGPDSHYVQDVNSSADGYVQSYSDSMPVVAREPKDSLLIFASPFPAADMVPSNADEIHYVEPGLVQGLTNENKAVIWFSPGVYWLTGSAHAILSPSTTWVYLAPGAYVKGAIQYTNTNARLKASGFGVLSGEQYVYQANTQLGYKNHKSDDYSLRMWAGHGINAGQSWTMNGITTNAAPFNVMNFYGATEQDIQQFSVDVSDYKQVGSFFWQTDGLEIYPNSHIRDVFLHTGDDSLKAYYSNVLVERIVVWKTSNAPVIQVGWHPRDIRNIKIDKLDVIHCRYFSDNKWAPRALIGSSASYHDVLATNTADTSTRISNFTVSNLRSEGISPRLVGLNMLSNLSNFVVENVWIEEFAPATTQIDVSFMYGFTNKGNEENRNTKVMLGARSPPQRGMAIKNYIVGDQKIAFVANNWDAESVGRLYIDTDYWGNWIVE